MIALRRPRRPSHEAKPRGWSSCQGDCPKPPDYGNVAWAVYLGCDTPYRLAREWGIGKQLAASMLHSSYRCGFIRRVGYGEYASDRPDAKGEA